MKIQAYNQEGQKVEEVALPSAIFDIPWNADLVHQVVTSQQSNRRIVRANTKGRGEVRGGGKKPWAQKHTGRARHGSIRSPLWKGGGVTGGPTKERVFAKKINTKMRVGALFALLSARARENALVVLDTLETAGRKTKTLKGTLVKLPSDTRPTLLVLPAMERNLISAASNIPFVQTIQAKDLNALDVATYQYVVLPQKSIEIIEKTFRKA
ncbi:MAG: 50S ribosomal protein L4 [Candidatus Wildermuthbacteria bacterium RIFCSPHIGHO2_02_FULL_47_12]|uniref:Large ribosomal subunit protein uL4 n=1 Tax=Candidatus Wildermuthbacteria bacterium RIFCSPHIGHO2_02_FULL_47_12 TaxID=1802451 RepID=A0A1G2R3R6_9BACT|nr:MAG: 50S ribosomal protein L4 [Candidatus Wildermuthbacteria bacterium RIFCSPHIGHO2_02_FULL_47_12]